MQIVNKGAYAATAAPGRKCRLPFPPPFNKCPDSNLRPRFGPSQINKPTRRQPGLLGPIGRVLPPEAANRPQPPPSGATQHGNSLGRARFSLGGVPGDGWGPCEGPRRRTGLWGSRGRRHPGVAGALEAAGGRKYSRIVASQWLGGSAQTMAAHVNRPPPWLARWPQNATGRAEFRRMLFNATDIRRFW